MSESDNIVVRPEGEGSILRTDKLVKRYGKRTVANGVSINVKQGEIVGLLGPNGAGKTTSFYMTTGLVVPNEGHVYIDDQEITNFPVYKRARAGIGCQLFWSTLEEDASLKKKIGAIGNIQRLMYIVIGNKNTNITELQTPNNVLNIFNGNRVDTCKRLIKHDKLWVNSQTTSNLTTTTLTTRKSVSKILTYLLQSEFANQTLHLINALLL